MAANKAFESWYYGEGDVVNGMDDPYDVAEAAWVAAEEFYGVHSTGKPSDDAHNSEEPNVGCV